MNIAPRIEEESEGRCGLVVSIDVAVTIMKRIKQ
jgi:hypothetical protein